MSPFHRSRRKQWFGALVLGVAISGWTGCQSLAPTQQQQLEAAEEMHRDVHPEYAAAVEVIGTVLYYVLQYFQCFR